MIQPRGINDHKSLRFIPHYLTLLDSKYIHDLALFLAEMSHFSNSRLFITHTFFSIPLNRIPTLRIIILRSLACVCVLPRRSHLLPNRELQDDALTGDSVSYGASSPATLLPGLLLADSVCRASHFLRTNF